MAPRVRLAQAVQVSPQGAFVFTVGSEAVAQAAAVELGTTAGEFVEVRKGINDGMQFIATVQDFKEGDRVEVEK
jgi:hypothetical protein